MNKTDSPVTNKLLAFQLEEQMINIKYVLCMVEESSVKKIKQDQGKECDCAGQ